MQEERQAIALFQSLGRDGVHQKLNALGATANERMKAAQAKMLNGFDDTNLTALDYMTNEERQERHLLVLSLALCVDLQAEAKARIQARRIAMRNQLKGEI